MREHGPVDGDELFDEFRMEAMVFISLRSHSNRVGNSNWVHGGISFPWKNEAVVLGRGDHGKKPFRLFLMLGPIFQEPDWKKKK
jgi:hypothetical protein